MAEARLMETLLALEMVRVTEAAAIASARFMGRGDRTAPIEPPSRRCAGRSTTSRCAGTIVIGEGERDEAPMLCIGEQVGVARARPAGDRHRGRSARGHQPRRHGLANAITVLAASERGGLLHAPDTYLDKLCVGPGRGRPRRHPRVADARTWNASRRRWAARSRT